MRWEDERYVRVYTRDTTDWVALGWEAQALFLLALRKLDRAGILELGKSGRRGLAALVGMPIEVVERVLPVLTEDGCLALNGSTLVAPNFIEAQEAKQSDAQRKRESRAAARDLAAAGVTNRDDSSRNVTGADEPPPLASVSVTPSCAVPSRTQETSLPSDPLPEFQAYPPAIERHPTPRGDAAESTPALVALMDALDAGGWHAGVPKSPATRGAANAIVARDTVAVCAGRLLAMVKRERDAGREPQPTIGWHMDTLNGGPLGGDRKPRNGAPRRAEAWEPIIEPPVRPFDPMTGKERVS
jgi:hypothetical protein